MRAAAWTLAALGTASAVVLAVLLSQGLSDRSPATEEEPAGRAARWADLLPWLIVSGALAFVLLLVALVLGIVARALRSRVTASGSGGPATDQAVLAVLSLAGPSLQVTRSAPGVVRVQVASVGAERGLVMLPFVLRLEMEILVRFDEQRRRYGYVSTWFENYGVSMNSETQYGVMRRRERGLFLTLDGVAAVGFDTGAVYDAIDTVLAPLGWSR